jgi:4-amino-4-deoxy-L-arabinose transferase-like glycosyltransferase
MANMKKSNFSRKEVFVFLLIMIIGAFLRVYQLDKYPAGFHGDEAWTGLIARQILKQGYIGFWSNSALGQPSLFFYWTAFLFKIFGDSASIVRLSFALLQILSLPCFYLLIRLLFSYEAALFSLFFFITGPVPLEFARRGDLPAVSFSFFPSIYFYLLSLKTNKWRYSLLSGLFLGLNNYAYHSYVLIAPILAAYTVLAVILNRKLFSIKKALIPFFILITTYLLVFSPLLLITMKSPYIVFGKFRSFSILSSEGLRHLKSYAPQVNSSFEAIIYNFKVSLPLFYSGHDDSMGSHVFDPIQAFFFSIGIIFAFRYAHKKYRLFPYFIFLTLFVTCIFTINAPTFRRFQSSIFWAYIFTGVGAWTCLIWSKRILKKYNIIGTTLIITLSFVSGIYNSYLFFSKYAVSQQTKSFTSYSFVVAADFINSLPQKTRIYFYSSIGPLNYETLRYLLRSNIEAKDRSIEGINYSDLMRDTEDQPVTYILFPNYLNLVNNLESIYPDGKKIEHKDTDDTLQFVSYSLPVISKKNL